MLCIRYSFESDKYKVYTIIGEVDSIFNTWYFMDKNKTNNHSSISTLVVSNLRGIELDPRKGINELYAGDY